MKIKITKMGTLFSRTPSEHITKENLQIVIQSLQMKQPLVDKLDETVDQVRIQWIVKHLLQIHHLLEKERPIQLTQELTTK